MKAKVKNAVINHYNRKFRNDYDKSRIGDLIFRRGDFMGIKHAKGLCIQQTWIDDYFSNEHQSMVIDMGNYK